jgi:cytochrome P450
VPSSCQGPNWCFRSPSQLEALRRQRLICPVRYPDGERGWLVLDYATARRVLADPRFQVYVPRSPVGDSSNASAGSHVLEDVVRQLPGAVISLHPPQHARLRRLQAGYFTVRRVEGLRPTIDQFMVQCLNAMESSGTPADLATQLLSPSPPRRYATCLREERTSRSSFAT